MTNAGSSAWSRALQASRIERNYSFLKDDEIVNALFLKRPERIEALGLILLISLLIWRLMELVMRTELQARQATVPGWDRNKPTAGPTAYMVTWKFKGVLVLCLGGQRLLAKPLTDIQLAFLQALQIPESSVTKGAIGNSTLQNLVILLGLRISFPKKRCAMKLDYDEVEDSYDEMTKIRTMTEQAVVQGKGVLLRTTIYSDHHLSVNVVFVPGAEPFDPVVG
jgi:hypothetical protein